MGTAFLQHEMNPSSGVSAPEPFLSVGFPGLLSSGNASDTPDRALLCKFLSVFIFAILTGHLPDLDGGAGGGVAA